MLPINFSSEKIVRTEDVYPLMLADAKWHTLILSE